MRLYEETLGKIAPVFHKFIRFMNYNTIEDEEDLEYYLRSYLTKFNLHLARYFDIHAPNRNISYVFLKSTLFLGVHYEHPTGIMPTARSKHTLIIFTEKNNLEVFTNMWSLYEFIVNIVLNNFSFEKDQIKLAIAPATYKDLFIALVGKDTAKTIINNIK